MNRSSRPESAIELTQRTLGNLQWLHDFADILTTDGIKRFANEEMKRLADALELLEHDTDDGK